MSVSKSIARKLVFPALKSLGVDKLLLLNSSKNSLIINFHGVTNINGNRFNNRHLDVNEFQKIITYLNSIFEIVPLSEIFEIHRNKTKTRRKTVALTFDDGYINNFTQALPVLKEHNVPATFYLISKGIIDNDYYVWPDIIDLVQREIKEDIRLDAGVFKYPGFFCNELNKSLVDFLKSAGSKREIYIQQLSFKYPFYKETAKKYPELIELIRKEQLKNYINEPLIEFGSHTHLHYNLEHLTKSECEFELRESKKIIEDCIGKQINSLAFPDGSYNKETIEVSLNCGYKNLTAVEYKFNENNSKSELLSRFTISNSTTFESNVFRLAMQFKKYAF